MLSFVQYMWWLSILNISWYGGNEKFVLQKFPFVLVWQCEICRLWSMVEFGCSANGRTACWNPSVALMVSYSLTLKTIAMVLPNFILLHKRPLHIHIICVSSEHACSYLWYLFKYAVHLMCMDGCTKNEFKSLEYG